MKGTKIELEERRHRQQLNKIKSEQPEYTTSKYCNSYSFRFEKPYRRKIDKPNLSITKIEFPLNATALNAGTSLERWAKKRAIFKHKSKAKKEEPADNEEELSLEINNNKSSPEPPVDEDENEAEEDIDYDVAQLILAAAELNEQEDKPQKKRKCKGVRFALSKPQSPQSIQVIRVDVTSSYEDDESSCEDYRERFQNLVEEANDEDDGEFAIVCQRLALLPRE